jgi:hypothetical protein
MPEHLWYENKMITRKQVARRIGKSIATVRKMEGVSLQPRTDAKGVHWFDEEDVDTVAEQIAITGRALDDAPWSCSGKDYGGGGLRRRCRTTSFEAAPPRSIAAGRVAELQNQLRELRAKHAAWKQRMDRACGQLIQAVAAIDEEGWAAVAQIEELLNEPC